MHRSPLNSPILAPTGLGLLCWGSTPTSRCANCTIPARQPDSSYPEQREELNLGGIRLLLPILVGSILPSLSGCKQLPPHVRTWVPGAATVRNYPNTHQRLRYVKASDIIIVLRAETTRFGIARLSFFPEDARMHSICSDGGMTMHIAGVLDCAIMAIGRWL